MRVFSLLHTDIQSLDLIHKIEDLYPFLVFCITYKFYMNLCQIRNLH